VPSNQEYKKLLRDVITSCDNAVYCFRDVSAFSDHVKQQIQAGLEKLER
jgi:hypothetical protein